jgi:hypothetical protein
MLSVFGPASDSTAWSMRASDRSASTGLPAASRASTVYVNGARGAATAALGVSVICSSFSLTDTGSST